MVKGIHNKIAFLLSELLPNSLTVFLVFHCLLDRGQFKVLGDANVEGVKIKNIKTGESTELACQGVFFFVGMIPSTGFLKDTGVKMDQQRYIPVNELMETNIEGVYAVGDNRVKYLRQIVSAAGDGATAAVAAERYIEETNDFQAKVLENERPVILSFFNPMVEESLAFNTVLEKVVNDNGDKYKIVKADNFP